MKTAPSHLLLLLLGACNGNGTPAEGNVAAEPTVQPARPSSAPAKPFVSDEKTDLIDFHYAWPAEAAAVPQLANRLRQDMAKAKAELLAGAREDQAMREEQGIEFHGFMSSTDYNTMGQSNRLLSLSVESGSYTGGAHGNYGVSALLWDRAANRQVQFAELFANPANMDRLLTQRWCDALNKEREKKRGEPIGGSGMFDECPELDEVAIIPGDKGKNGRFETLALVASPYVAGPWVEGAYEIELAVMPDLLAVLKDDYRLSFEGAQTQ